MSACKCALMRFAPGDPSWRESVLTSPVLIYYSNCASSTLIQNGIPVTGISNSLLNCRQWDNQWTVNSETPGTVSTTHLQEMKHLISLRPYDRAHYSTTFMDKSDIQIAITPISHHVHRFGLISAAQRTPDGESGYSVATRENYPVKHDDIYTRFSIETEKKPNRWLLNFWCSIGARVSASTRLQENTKCHSAVCVSYDWALFALLPVTFIKVWHFENSSRNEFASVICPIWLSSRWSRDSLASSQVRLLAFC